ncbi:PTS sugar transporter subunit IIB [Cetobacterium somerae]|uniref:PTS system mannose/fructose/N-acetylgalactosamine-transporter subunit IIB n=1 Tax=Cetobacterium somerae TaxID=188913 RepID=UPI00211DCE2D|nr:PTS sugar transporter subunit IIB [Cetobacterium somerae]MCQ9627917.1 PTS sugar transporter subunit IIB [Cetobacterium somerae]
MVILMRVDDRLVHGQVAFTWTKTLGVEAIVVANDVAANDSINKMALKMAAPAGVKMAIKTVEGAIELLNNPKAKDKRIFVVVKNTTDALEIVENVPGIENVNIGGIKKEEGKEMLTPAVFINDLDKENLRKISNLVSEVEIRQVPTDEKKYVKNII